MKYEINKIIREIANKKGLKYSEVDYHKWTKKTQTKKGVEVTLYSPETTRISRRYEVANLYDKLVYKNGETILRELNQKEIAKESFKLYKPTEKEIEEFVYRKCDYPVKWKFENGLVKYSYRKVDNWCGDGFRGGDCVRSAVTDNIGYDEEAYYNEEIEKKLNEIIENNREKFFTPSKIKLNIETTFITWKEIREEILKTRSYAINSNKETFDKEKEYFKSLTTGEVYNGYSYPVTNLEWEIKDKSKTLLYGRDWFLPKKWAKKFEALKKETFEKIVAGYKEIEIPAGRETFKALIPENDRVVTLKLTGDFIKYMGLIIGKNGANIKALQEKYGGIRIKLIKFKENK